MASVVINNAFTLGLEYAAARLYGLLDDYTHFMSVDDTFCFTKAVVRITLFQPPFINFITHSRCDALKSSLFFLSSLTEIAERLCRVGL